MHRAREAAAQELRDEGEAGRREALHVGDAAAVAPCRRSASPRTDRCPTAGRRPGRRRYARTARCRPVVALPSRAGSVANRFALRRSSSNVSVDCDAVRRRDSRAPSRSARGSIRGSWCRSATSVRISSQARRSRRRARRRHRVARRCSVAGAFMAAFPAPGRGARWAMGQDRQAAPALSNRSGRADVAMRPDAHRASLSERCRHAASRAAGDA